MVVHQSGETEIDYPLENLTTLLNELNGIEDEMAQVALTHQSDWCLSINPQGLLMWENNILPLEYCWYMEGVSQEKVVALWHLLAQGEIDKIKQENWIEGDPLFD